MSIKIDLANQVRQTSVPAWKPLLPLFEAVMNSYQAIDENGPSGSTTRRILIDVERQSHLFTNQTSPITGFRIEDSGIGLNEDNYNSFNTAYSPYKISNGGKGLGRFTWLKAFEKVEIVSIFSENEQLFRRSFVFDPDYDIDERGEATPVDMGQTGTTISLIGFRHKYRDRCPQTTEAIAQKLIEHFILLLLDDKCPRVILRDSDDLYQINDIFQNEYRNHASLHRFCVGSWPFSMYGFRLPTGRTTKHKLVYAADNRAVISENLEELLPNLRHRLDDDDGNAFFYLAVVHGSYLSDHVNLSRTDFEFATSEDADLELELKPESLVSKDDIRNEVIDYVQRDLRDIIDSINAEKIRRIENYVHTDAPQYRILMKYIDGFVDSLSQKPSRSEIESALHKELHLRETRLRQESKRIIKESDKIDDYDTYYNRMNEFLDQYNELGTSALVQYVAHRKIILEFLKRAIELPEKSTSYPLEQVVHKLIFPMRTSSTENPYHEQNLWIIDERLTYHSLITSDIPLSTTEILENDSKRRGDIVIYDKKILFSDIDYKEHPINSITIIEFKRPGRDDFTELDNPIHQGLQLVDDIRSGKFKIDGRPVSMTNELVPAYIYCICDIGPKLRTVLRKLDAFSAPDRQGFYGFNKSYNAYYEITDYNKMLRDAKNRNRIFFEKLNIHHAQRES